MGPFLYEAELMALDVYRIQNAGSASNGQRIFTNSSTAVATATQAFTEAAGVYNITIRVLDEPTGAAPLDLYVDGNLVESFVLDQATASIAYIDLVSTNVALTSSSSIELRATRDGDERARVDYIEVEQVAVTERYEAENMTLSVYNVQNTASASNGQRIFSNNSTDPATASMVYAGATGVYDLSVRVFDEIGDSATVAVVVDGRTLETFTLDVEGGADSYQILSLTGIALDNGSTIELVGQRVGAERARIDYLEVTSSTQADASPVAVDDSYSAVASAPVALTPASNDFDNEDGTPTVSAINGVALTGGAQSIATANGAVNIDAGGVITYTSNAGFNGTESFTYTVEDTASNTDTGTIDIEVSAGNLGPFRLEAEDMTLSIYRVQSTASASGGERIFSNNTADVATATTTFTGDSAIYDLTLRAFDQTGGDGTVAVFINGAELQNFTLDQATTSNFYSELVMNAVSLSNGDTIEIRGQRDGADRARVDYLDVVYSPGANAAPNAIDIAYYAPTDTALEVTPLDNATDLEDGVPTLTHINGVALTGAAQSIAVTNGTVDIDAGGNISFTASAAFMGDVSFSYTVTDSAGQTDTADINVTVADSYLVNFQTPNATLPAGYQKDVGEGFDLSRGYGWIEQDDVGLADRDPVDLTDRDRVRNTDPDPRLDTFVIMQDDTGTFPSGAWEVAVADGLYQVTLSVGDTNNFNSSHTINVEGVNVISSFVPNAGDVFETGTVQVNVTDGYLTVDALGGVDTKLNYVDIVAVIGATPPDAMNDSYTLDEDDPATALDILANDNHPNSESFSLVELAGVAIDVSGGDQTISLTEGDLVVAQSNLAVSFTPATDYNGSLDFTYVIEDGEAEQDTATVSVTVNAVNDAPVAVDDAATVDQDTSGNAIDLLANDTDVEGDALTVTNIAGTAVTANASIDVGDGTVDVAADGVTLTFTPDPAFTGVVSFAYTVSDGALPDTGQMDVTVVAPANFEAYINFERPATTTPAGYTKDEGLAYDAGRGFGWIELATDTPIGNQFQERNTDPDKRLDTFAYFERSGNPETYWEYDLANGFYELTVSVGDAIRIDSDHIINAEGIEILNYTPTTGNNFFSTTTIIEVTDGKLTLDSIGGDDTKINYIDIIGAGPLTPPDAVDDTFGINEDATATALALLANDSHPNSESFSLVELAGVAIDVSGGDQTISLTEGDLVVAQADLSVTFTPAADFNGPVNFTYRIEDGEGDQDIANVTVNVAPINDDPVAVDDVANVVENGSVQLTLLTNDTDVDGDTLSVATIAGQAVVALASIDVGDGTVDVAADGETLTFTPDANFAGVVSFAYEVSDGTTTDAGQVDVTVTSTDFQILINFERPATATPTGYTKDDGSAYDAGRGYGWIELATGAPIATDFQERNLEADKRLDTFAYFERTGDPETFWEIDVANGFYQIELSVGDIFRTDSVHVINVEGQNVIAGFDPDETGTPTGGVFFETVSAVVEVTDGKLTVDSIGGDNTKINYIDIYGVSTPPDAVDDSFTMTEDGGPIAIDLLANDSDFEDGTPALIIIDNDIVDTSAGDQTINVSNGTVVVTQAGAITYDPDLNFAGVETFMYSVEDSDGTRDSAVVDITVNAVNDAPVATDDVINVNENTLVALGLLSNDFDVDGEPVVFETINGVTVDTSGGDQTIDVGNGDVIVRQATGLADFIGDVGFTGAVNFSYVLEDGAGLQDTANVTLNVNAFAELTLSTSTDFIYNDLLLAQDWEIEDSNHPNSEEKEFGIVTIENTGTADLTISDISITSGGSVFFIEDETFEPAVNYGSVGAAGINGYLGRFTGTRNNQSDISAVAEKTFDTTGEASVTAEFTFVEFDRWDSDDGNAGNGIQERDQYLYVYVNGVQVKIGPDVNSATGGFAQDVDETAGGSVTGSVTQGGVTINWTLSEFIDPVSGLRDDGSEDLGHTSDISSDNDGNGIPDNLDQRHTITLEVSGQGDDFTLGFGSNLNEVGAFESFAIDNLLITGDTSANTIADESFDGGNVTGWTDPRYVHADPLPTYPETLAPGETLDVRVRFDATGDATDSHRLDTGTLTITSDDPLNPTADVDLAGLWQYRAEGGHEPQVDDILDAFDLFTSSTGALATDFDRPGIFGDEEVTILVDDGGTIIENRPYYWTRADVTEDVTITQFAVWASQSTTPDTYVYEYDYVGAANGGTIPVDVVQTASFINEDLVEGLSSARSFDVESNDGQTFLPTQNNKADASSITFTPQASKEAFSFRVATMYTDTARNADDELGIRFYEAYDRDGARLEDAYVMLMDYDGGNADYNDNMYYVENITPFLA